MANWSNPGLTTAYATFLSEMKDRDTDAATMAEAPTNPPTGYIKWVVASNKFQRWNGAAYVDLVLAVAGGGTGGTSAFGTMAFQNSNAIAVTGGTLAGITSCQLAGDLTFDGDGTRKVGSNANKVNVAYVKNGLVIPVGTDKWATS